jgi:phosphohistidine phosphatase
VSGRLLTLIRHAEASSQRAPGRRDFDRPLTPAGERDVVEIAARLSRLGLSPDRLAASTARRAQMTADAVADAIGFPRARIDRVEALYMASHRQLRAEVEATDDRVGHLALVGHNPGLSLLWGWLAADDGAELPTCGVARLALEIDAWAAAYEGCARLVAFDAPGVRPLDPGRDVGPR